MPIELDPNRQHQWFRISVTPLEWDSKLQVLAPTAEPVTEIGCWTCNMGFDEGKDVNCPGRDLFEEVSHD